MSRYFKQINFFAFIAALVLAISFPPFDEWLLVLPAMALLALGFIREIHKDSKLSWAWVKVVFQYTVFVYIFGFYWLSYTLREFGGLSWFISVPVTLLIFFAHGVLPGLFFGLLGIVLDKNPLWKFFLKSHSWALFLFLSLVFIVWDAFDFRVFPWSPIQGLGSNREILASVFYLGTGGWRLIIFACAVLWGLCLNSKNTRLRRGSALLSLVPALVGVPIGLKAIRTHMQKYKLTQPVALIQGNIGNNEKKISKLGVEPTIKNVVSIHDSLISKIEAKVKRENKAEELWTFWPETSYPLFPTEHTRDSEFLLRSSERTQGPHFVGTYEKSETLFGGEKIWLDFNIVAGFDSRSGFLGRYQKHIRVYFGEYIPGDDYFPSVYSLLPQVPHFGRGDTFDGIYHREEKGPVFISLICYEILYRSYVHSFIKKIQEELKAKGQDRDIILLNSTNDSWYGKTSEPYQHSLLARWNIAEVGLPALRPTNTGFSQVISPWGEVLSQGSQDEMSVIYGDLPVSQAVLK